MKSKKKDNKYEEVKELRYNKQMSIEELAQYFGTSKRTIYRWLQKARQDKDSENTPSKKTYSRKRRYPDKIFTRIVELKKEVPRRSTPMIHRLLEKLLMGISGSIGISGK
ncbi:MAG: helix-turn-helix domain-containing protein [Promethearchaeia archaeon]